MAQIPSSVQRLLVLGDSISYAGGYVTRLDAALEAAGRRIEVLNLGLPSETCSGLSEPGHAGGAFPRPSVHERLSRVLTMIKPDMVMACYGMNCGIYHPWSAGRAQKYFEGRIALQAACAGGSIRAHVLHLTPPPFDALPLKGKTLPAGLAEYKQPYERYDDVLQAYSEWLMAQKKERQWDVCDIRPPLQQRLAEGRMTDPSFVLAGDGVHLNDEGHWLITRALLSHLELPSAKATTDREFTEMVGKAMERARKRQSFLKDAWLSLCGHLRPGMNSGLPLHKAYEAAREFLVPRSG